MCVLSHLRALYTFNPGPSCVDSAAPSCQDAAKAGNAHARALRPVRHAHTQVPEGASRPDVYYAHPEPWPARHTEALATYYGGRVFLCGSETDSSHPGYIEGAVRTGKKGAEAVRDVVAACRAA